jgi:phosphoglycolate phosphatase-like HAD superfamily hydrolase
MGVLSMPHFFLALIIILQNCAAFAADPLPAWNDGKTKSAIVQFVTKVSDEKNPGFIPVAERIAVFDLDGTLINEKPVFMQALFLDFLVDNAIYKNPALENDPDFKLFINRSGWKDYFTKTPWESTLKVYAATHTGMSQQLFSRMVQDYMESNPQFRRIIYAPMKELLHYLRAGGFKTYIITGSEGQFVRNFSESYFGVPPEQVIGTSWKTSVKEENGLLSVQRLPELETLNDKEQKVLAIDRFIGRKPVFAAGNDGNSGDIPMLRYTTQTGERPGFGLIIAHNDDKRESVYTDQDGATLKAAEKYRWTVARVKEDWKVLYSGAATANNAANIH